MYYSYNIIFIGARFKKKKLNRLIIVIINKIAKIIPRENIWE